MHQFGLSPKYRYGDLVFMTEQLPNANSRVRLSGRVHDRHDYPVAQIEWRLTEEDFAVLKLIQKCYLNRDFGVRIITSRESMNKENGAGPSTPPLTIWARLVWQKIHAMAWWIEI